MKELIELTVDEVNALPSYEKYMVLRFRREWLKKQRKQDRHEHNINKSKIYSFTHREEKKQYRKTYTQKNRVKILAKQKEWRKNNKEKLKEYHKQYNILNREIIKAKARKYYKKKREEILAKQEKWRKEIRQRRLKQHILKQKKSFGRHYIKNLNETLLRNIKLK